MIFKRLFHYFLDKIIYSFLLKVLKNMNKWTWKMLSRSIILVIIKICLINFSFICIKFLMIKLFKHKKDNVLWKTTHIEKESVIWIQNIIEYAFPNTSIEHSCSKNYFMSKSYSLWFIEAIVWFWNNRNYKSDFDLKWFSPIAS